MRVYFGLIQPHVGRLLFHDLWLTPPAQAPAPKRECAVYTSAAVRQKGSPPHLPSSLFSLSIYVYMYLFSIWNTNTSGWSYHAAVTTGTIGTSLGQEAPTRKLHSLSLQPNHSCGPDSRHESGVYASCGFPLEPADEAGY